MELGWRVASTIVAAAGAWAIHPLRDSRGLRDDLVRFGLPYVGLYAVGTLIGHWMGIL